METLVDDGFGYPRHDKMVLIILGHGGLHEQIFFSEKHFLFCFVLFFFMVNTTKSTQTLSPVKKTKKGGEMLLYRSEDDGGTTDGSTALLLTDTNRLDPDIQQGMDECAAWRQYLPYSFHRYVLLPERISSSPEDNFTLWYPCPTTNTILFHDRVGHWMQHLPGPVWKRKLRFAFEHSWCTLQHLQSIQRVHGRITARSWVCNPASRFPGDPLLIMGGGEEMVYAYEMRLWKILQHTTGDKALSTEDIMEVWNRFAADMHPWWSPAIPSWVRACIQCKVRRQQEKIVQEMMQRAGDRHAMAAVWMQWIHGWQETYPEEAAAWDEYRERCHVEWQR
jgi:hypothetical protein